MLLTQRRGRVFNNPASCSGRTFFQISTRSLAILTEGFNGSPQSLKANAGILPKIRLQSLSSKYFSIHHSLTTLSPNTIYGQFTERAWQYKLQKKKNATLYRTMKESTQLAK
jgi:hypothetical protein